METKTTLAFCLGILLIAGCATVKAPQTPPEAYEPEVRAFVDGLVTDYVTDNRESFFARFDDKVFPEFAGYKEQVRLHLVQRRLHMLDLVPDHIHRVGDQAAVAAHWRRTYDNFDGQPMEDRGACTIAIEAAPTGVFYIKDIQGDSPF